jgi:F-type H+-transporting ATPase subunit b
MLIDWFTVVAQGLNFLVLVWLLKRYLYKPVLAAIDAREKQIALAIAEVASKSAAAEQERKEFAEKKAALDVEAAAFLKQAASTAGTERARLLADAHAEADALRVKQMTALRDDQTRLSQGIARLAQQEVLAISRKVLGDLADVSLEERMAVVFAQRLRSLDAAAKATLAAALGGAPEAVVRSAFDLPEAQRALIQSAVDETFARSITLRFDTSPDTLCGVELTAGGQKLAWSMADYLAVLEQKIASLRVAERAPSAALMPAPPPQAAIAAIPAIAAAVPTP